MNLRNSKLVIIIIVAVAVFSVGLHSFARVSYSSSTSIPTGEDASEELVEYYLVDIDIVSDTEGWALTSSGHVLQYDGTAWRVVGNLSEPGLEVVAIAIDMVSSTDGWVIGSGFDTIRNSDSPSLIWHYDGVTWTRIPAPVSSNPHHCCYSSLNLSTIEMTSSSDGWIMGDRELLRYNGVAWESVLHVGDLTPPCQSGDNCQFSFTHLDAVDEDNVWVVVSYGTDHFTLHFDGVDWQVQDQVSRRYDIDMEMVDTDEGWLAVSSDSYQNQFEHVRTGLVKQYDGTSWFTQTLAYTGTIYSLASTPNSNVVYGLGKTFYCPNEFCETNGHHLLKYSDGEWHIATHIQVLDDFPVKASVVSEDELWATARGDLFHYLDGAWTHYPLTVLNNNTPQIVESGSFLRFTGDGFVSAREVAICVNGHLLTKIVTADLGYLEFNIQTLETAEVGGYIVEMGTALNCSADTIAANEDDTVRSSFFLQDDAPFLLKPDFPRGPVFNLPQDLPSLPPSITISNPVSPTVALVPGANVTFTVDITNTGAGALRVSKLSDSQLGDITDSANPSLTSTDCLLPSILAEREAYMCQYSMYVETDEPTWYTSTVTIEAVSVLSTTVNATASSAVEVVAPPSEFTNNYLPAIVQ